MIGKIVLGFSGRRFCLVISMAVLWNAGSRGIRFGEEEPEGRAGQQGKEERFSLPLWHLQHLEL